MKVKVAVFAIVLLSILGQVALAGEYTVFGPKAFERGTGKPVAETVSFESPVAGADFTFKGFSGDENGKKRVSSGEAVLNHQYVAHSSDFNQQVEHIEKVVPLGFHNEVSVHLAGKPGSTLTVTITGVDDTPPQVTINDPVDGLITEAEMIAVSGTVVDDTPVTVTVNGTPVEPVGETFSLDDVGLEIGENLITVSATDLGGNVSNVSVTITRQLPRPKVEPQPEGSFGAKYEDLIPEDATKESYDPKRFSLITGKVKGLDNQPIPDVTVSMGANSCVECHGNEYGSVKTDAEGRFTIPVEGGATMTVAYEKPGLITSHRQVYVPWNDWAVAETIQMIPEDTASTEVTFDGNPETVVTHRSTPVTDEFGTRSATLVFTGDNKAYEVDAGGNVIRELDSITTRATEFITPESMPAVLPPTSAYTYCAEFSVDGAQRVEFAKPVVGWVDNFLGFDVAEIVPVGYYDRDRGVWVPSDNGEVVMLLDTDGDGIVDALDSDGDNLPNDLNGDGFYNDEVRGLEDSSRYRSGSTFWRFAVTHFTPWDCNWPYGPPLDAIPPNPEGEPEVQQQESETEKPCDDSSEISSFVEDRSRIFHEDIAIPGTDMTLHYASNRVKGYRSNISVPVSGATVPSSLKGIVVNVNIAGRSFSQVLLPLPNQKSEFVWDGLDGLGRQVSGPVTANIDIGFVYEAVYYSASDRSDQAFANAGSDVTGIRARRVIVTWKRTQKVIDVDYGEKGVGLLAEGWSFSKQHYLSPKDTGTLFKGDGGKIKTRGTIISTVAGDGSPGYSGDNGPATNARLRSPEGVAVDAAGNLYVADRGNFRIRKIGRNGIITTVAGNGNWQYSGDGGPAVQAGINFPYDVAVDAAGNLYIADYGNDRIRKVDANGIITTVAGRNPGGFNGDNIPATQALLYGPTGVAVNDIGNLYIADYGNNRIRKVDITGTIYTIAGGEYGFAGDNGPATQAYTRRPQKVALDEAGNIYLADNGNYRIRKVDASGTITTVAGNGLNAFGGDAGPAVEAAIRPLGVAVNAVGDLYIADRNYRIRKVTSAGIITTVAGNGIRGDLNEGILATQAMLNSPGNVAVDSAGNLYIAEAGENRVLKVAPISSITKEGTVAGDYYFTEANGLAHVISNTGMHKKTIDLDSGKTLRTFGYDGNDNLITIADRFGTVTTINRDADGVPISIVSPDGLTTHLTVDQNDLLTRVSYPDGTSYNFEYTSDGLMTAETDPNGNRFEHVFDVGGRLTDVTDPEGGHWNYKRTANSNGDIQVKKTTGEGNTTTYLDRTDSTGAYTSTITGPSGGVSTFTRTADGLTETSDLSCGMEVLSKYDLDPEYKLKFVKERTESTPAGKSRLTLRDKTYLDADGNEIPDRITETITLNGKVTTLLHDVLQAKKEVTSPAGRKVTSTYNPATLLTQSLSVSGLNDVTYAYDEKGRLTTLGRGERQTSFAYTDKGFLASVTDPKSRTTTYDHDAMGRVTAIHRPDGSAVGFTYDNNGNMTVLANPFAIDHGFDYNGVDKKTDYQAPQSGSYRYFYDRDRRLVETRFPSGRQIRNIYTNTQLTQVQTPEGNIDLDYLCSTKLGSMTKNGEKSVFDYDGKLLTEETLVGTLNQSLTYTYNDDFNVTAFSYAGGTVNLSYDNDGLLTGSGDFTISRNAGNGLPESVSDGTFSLDRSFNGYGEIAGEATAIGGLEPYAYNLTRNASGRITGKTEDVAGEGVAYDYTYDDMGRLLTVTRDGQLVEQYQYDEVGRRTYEKNTLRGIAGRYYAYSAEDHLLTAGDISYQYDLDGFLTSKTDASGTTAYTYSSRGELLKVILPDGKVIEYFHDPQGRRIAKKVDGAVIEKYLWQGRTRLLAIYDGSDNLLLRFQYADARMPVAMTKDGETYYFAYDQVGSLGVVTDASGNVIKKIEYDSFGNILADSNPGFTVPFGFAGGLHDRDIDLVRFGFRDYDPVIGRWTAKDPIEFAGGDVNVYNYVYSEPINLIDPWGLAWFRPQDHEYTVGRPGSPVEPGKGIGRIIDDYVPAGHTFGANHDAFVGWATSNEAPDLLINIPSMGTIYVISVYQELNNSILGLLGVDIFDHKKPATCKP